MFYKTEPHLLERVLRVRVGLIIQVCDGSLVELLPLMLETWVQSPGQAALHPFGVGKVSSRRPLHGKPWGLATGRASGCKTLAI